VLSGRGLCDELITRPEESYRLWRVVVCDLETSKEEAKSPLKGCEYKPTMGCDAKRKKIRDKFLSLNIIPSLINPYAVYLVLLTSKTKIYQAKDGRFC
jgi:hypothetical protein